VNFDEGTDYDTNVTMTLSAPVASGHHQACDWHADPALSVNPFFPIGLLAPPSGATVADGAPPVLIAARTVDSDNNGFVDGIQVTFSESVVVATVFAADFTISPAYTITSVSTSGGAANNWIVTLVVTESINNDGAATPNVTYTRPVSRLMDPAGNAMRTGSTVQASDGVLPRLVSATGVSVDNHLTITFSEAVSKCGSRAALTASDFQYHDGNMAAAQTLQSISGTGAVVQGIVQPNFAQSDFNGIGTGDSINAVSGNICDSNGNPVPPTEIALAGPSAAFQVVTAVWLCVLLIVVALLAV